jgi:hypothetical protein
MRSERLSFRSRGAILLLSTNSAHCTVMTTTLALEVLQKNFISASKLQTRNHFGYNVCKGAIDNIETSKLIKRLYG